VYQHLSYLYLNFYARARYSVLFSLVNLYLNSYVRARYSVLFSLVNLYLNSYVRARYSFLFCLFCGDGVLMVQSWTTVVFPEFRILIATAG